MSTDELQTVALPTVAHMAPDGRVVPGRTMRDAVRDGGAMLSSLRGYSVPLVRRKDALSRVEALERERDALKLQAQIWAQEAKSQKATVQAAYQACTGATGEPGDWNGAAPIRALAAERDSLRRLLVECDDAAKRLTGDVTCLYLIDAIDNDGEPYQSQHLADVLAAARAAIAKEQQP